MGFRPFFLFGTIWAAIAVPVWLSAYVHENSIFGWTPPGAPLHALTIGAIGTMTLAVMTRAMLGHTGRALSTDATTVAIYVLVSLAALLRVAAPLSGQWLLWLTSFAGVTT